MMPEVLKREHSVQEPLNREPKITDLIQSFITPKEHDYDRNHGPIPHIDGATHKIKIDGAVSSSITLSLEDLSKNYEQHTVIAAMQCAGNRRHTMRTELAEVQGIDWLNGAVFNAIWRGPRLCDILSAARIDLPTELDWQNDPSVAHVQLACNTQETQDDSYYGGSVPLSRAIDRSAEVILATEMNGEPLTPNRGFPVRVVVPGVTGARNVKWIDRVTVSTKESGNFYQQRDYKVLPPQATDAKIAEKYWDGTPPIQDMPINSVVAVPRDGDHLKRDSKSRVRATGYALPQGKDGPIIRVEVSGDEGASWIDAHLNFGEMEGRKDVETEKLRWAWCLWEADVEIEPGTSRKIWSRATDKAGNVQPQCGQWTLRGVLYNAYGEAKDLEVS